MGSGGYLVWFWLAGRFGQTADHQSNEREHHPGLGGVRQQFIVSVQAALKGHPGNAALDDPALLDDLEAAVPTKGPPAVLRSVPAP